MAVEDGVLVAKTGDDNRLLRRLLGNRKKKALRTASADYKVKNLQGYPTFQGFDGTPFVMKTEPTIIKDISVTWDEDEEESTNS